MLLTASVRPTMAASRHACREACAVAIASCVNQGYRLRFCAKEVIALCERGSTICHATTSTTATLPLCITTATTTIAPTAPCLGPAGCNVAPSGVTSTIASADALRAALLGLWYKCNSTPAAFGSSAAGIEFASDGSWYFLTSDNGTLVRENGLGEAGMYDIIDTSLENGPGHFQLNLNLNTGSTYLVQWTLSAQPQLLRVVNGDQVALYSHMPGASACTSAPAL